MGRRRPIGMWAGGLLMDMVPGGVLFRRRRNLLEGWEDRGDADYLRWRRDIYFPRQEEFCIPADDPTGVKLRNVNWRHFHSHYAFDARRALRYWPGEMRIRFCDGDVLSNPEAPALIKARRLDAPGASDAAILKLDSIRHFLTPHDNIPFRKKIPKLFFRGECHGKPARLEFLRRYQGSALCDIGDTARRHPSEWQREPLPIPRQFNYRFILTLEGNDVASSLQWVMASGCVPVMPRPKVESWLMHSQLKAGVHYIEIADDYSDVEEKISHYVEHEAEAQTISEESTRWAGQFDDSRRELLVSLLVVEKYLRLSGQL